VGISLLAELTAASSGIIADNTSIIRYCNNQRGHPGPKSKSKFAETDQQLAAKSDRAIGVAACRVYPSAGDRRLAANRFLILIDDSSQHRDRGR